MATPGSVGSSRGAAGVSALSDAAQLVVADPAAHEGAVDHEQVVDVAPHLPAAGLAVRPGGRAVHGRDLDADRGGRQAQHVERQAVQVGVAVRGVAVAQAGGGHVRVDQPGERSGVGGVLLQPRHQRAGVQGGYVLAAVGDDQLADLLGRQADGRVELDFDQIHNELQG